MRRAVLALGLAASLSLGAALAAPAGPTGPATAAIDGRLALARDGKLVVAEGGATRVVFEPPPDAWALDPAFSPDGAALAFAEVLPRAAADGQPPAGAPPGADLLIVAADGSGPRTAVAHDAPDVTLSEPAWSPDGAALYYGYDRVTYSDGRFAGETREVRRTDLASGATATLAQDAASPSPSPDGAWVALVGQDWSAGDSLRLVRADGSGERVLVAPGAFAALALPRFSPDGATVAFAGLRAADGAWDAPDTPAGPLGRLLGPGVALAHGLPWEIWTVPVPAAAGAPRQVTRIGEDMPCPAWSADARRLLVQGEMGLYLVDAAAGTTRALGDPPGWGVFDWRSGP